MLSSRVTSHSSGCSSKHHPTSAKNLPIWLYTACHPADCCSIQMKWRADHIYCTSHACEMITDHFVLGWTWNCSALFSVDTACVWPCPLSTCCPPPRVQHLACLLSLHVDVFVCVRVCLHVLLCLGSSLCACGRWFFQMGWRSVTSHIRRELIVLRFNWSAR